MTAAIKRFRENDGETSYQGEWLCDSNLAVELNFVSPTETQENTFYHPKFTYWASNQDEKWFGYKGLKLQIFFSAASFRVYYSLKYDDKLSETNSYFTPPDDVLSSILEYLPSDRHDNLESFKNGLIKEEFEFKPFGDRIYEQLDVSHSITKRIKQINNNLNIQSASLEMYKSTYFTPGFRDYYHRFKILAPFFIEGATELEVDNPRWEFVSMYSKITIEDPSDSSSSLEIYQLLGFSNIYNFYNYPDKSRVRISQFIILPPYHKLGLGSLLYLSIFKHYTKMDNVIDFGVEEPNNDFSDVRDLSDLKLFVESPIFSTLAIPYDEDFIRKIYQTFKFSKKQVHRVVELAHLYRVFSIKDTKDYQTQFNAFKLQVKRRLYKVNSVGLSHLPPTEMKIQLEELFNKFVDDYIRLVKKFSLE